MTEMVAELFVVNKILELTENKEAVLRERIPRLRIMSLITALRNIKKEEEAEKFDEVIFGPPIFFILEESHIDKWDKKKLVLLVNPNAVKKGDKKKHHQEKFPCAFVRFGKRIPEIHK